MKKVLTISLAFFYLVVVSGVFLNLHYCGGNLKKVAFYSVSNEDGCCGSKEKSHGCCKDKASFIKVKDGHHAFGAVKVNLSLIKCCDIFQPELKIYLTGDYSEYKKADFDPPVFYDNPIYLKYKVLLI